MRFIDQTTFYDPESTPNKQRGNCLTAVVASFLDLSIEAVPNFVQDDVDHEGDPNWDWWRSLIEFVRTQGRELVYLNPVENPGATYGAFRDPEPDEFYAVIGVSPRDPNIRHIVIYQNGQLVHDPHPDRSGLLTVTDNYHWALEN